MSGPRRWWVPAAVLLLASAAGAQTLEERLDEERFLEGLVSS